MERYDLCLGYNHDGSPYATAEISPYNDGEWVRYSDVEALQARVRELEEQLSDAIQYIDKLSKATP